MRGMLRVDEPEQPVAPRGFALFALAFRPFYLLAALFSALAVPIWVAVLEGRFALPGSLPGILWHQHEMVFGFALAVIGGFVLTAGRVWTGLPTPTGIPLALLAAHWLAARVLLAVAPAPLAAVVDSAFPFALAAAIAGVLFRSRNTRNYFVIALLAALGIADIAFYLAAAGVLGIAPQAAVKFALYLVLTLIIVMAGRVVPPFTGNALPQAKVLRRPRLDSASVVVSLLAFAFDLLGASAWLVAPAALAAALMHGVRQAGWAPFATLGKPIVWSLHAGHAWLPIGFLLLALASIGLVPSAVALHAFGLGAMGGMIIAMITRTALGHTARPLAAGRAETAAYALVHVAALVRVLAGLVAGPAYLPLVGAAGLAWSAAFLVYFIAYLPRLIRPRLDGKPG
jgi:uncharacterized protein involved in response to NO